MATAKKTVAKKTTKVATTPPKRKVATTPPKQETVRIVHVPEPVYGMPREVKEWIEQATSRMKHMGGEIERLKEENNALKAYRKFAEHRILRSEAE
jgi:hypothetical protein